MKNDKVTRYKAGIAALLVSSSMLLAGCQEGFKLTIDEERNITGEADSYLDNDFLQKCYVVEAKSKITNESNIYIAKKRQSWALPTEVDTYFDIFTNRRLFNNDNSYNESFDYIKETMLFDYLISLDLIKGAYSYEDMNRIYNEIKKVYEFEYEKELVK